MANSDSPKPQPVGPTLEKIIADYLELLERGHPPPQEEWLNQHPAHAEELRNFLAEPERFADKLASSSDVHQPDVEAATMPLASPAPSAPRPQQQAERPFGDYLLIEEIARGGMGVVYKARQQSLNRMVALKMIIAGELASDEDVRRFRMEAEAAGNLDHPGIVPVFEVGERGGQHYLTMAYVPGPSLADLLTDGPLPIAQAVELVNKMTEAVNFAHESGVVHRDLKPGNVLLQQSGSATNHDADSTKTRAGNSKSRQGARGWQPRITDFGLAKRIESDTALTGTGQVLGTPSYMAPEQVVGDPNRIGPATDVYALGAVLFCVLTGRPPFQAATNVETMLQVFERRTGFATPIESSGASRFGNDLSQMPGKEST